MRRTVAAEGYTEAVTFSFTAEAAARPFADGPPVRLMNPISSDLDVLRPVAVAEPAQGRCRQPRQAARGGGSVRVGPALHRDGCRREQAVALAGLRFGHMVERHWAEAARPVDAFDAKADAFTALAAAGVRVEAVTVTAGASAHYHPGRSGKLTLGPQQVLAEFGELHPRVRQAFDLDLPAVAFEIDLDRCPSPSGGGGARSNSCPTRRSIATSPSSSTSASPRTRS